MTVLSETNRVSYVSDGVTLGPFPAPFYFLDEADLIVVSGQNGNTTVMPLNSAYTVSGAGDPAGGSITLIGMPVAGSELVIYRSPTMTQDASFVDHSRFPAASNEAALDKGRMIEQRTRELVLRTPQLADSDVDGTGAYHGNHNRFADLGDPIFPQDAVTKAFIANFLSQALAAYTALQFTDDGRVVVTAFRFSAPGVARTDLQMFEAARAFAVANNRGKIVVPPGQYDFQNGTLFLNAGGTNTSGPTDALASFEGMGAGGATTSVGVNIINAIIHVGSGFAYTSAGNRLDNSTQFIQRAMSFKNIRIEGGLRRICLQNSTIFENVKVKPLPIVADTQAVVVGGAVVAAPQVANSRGIWSAFCNTIIDIGCRCDNGGDGMDGFVDDSCQDHVIIAGAGNTGRVGFQCLQEFVYTPPNPNGSSGSARETGLQILGLHLEQNYKEAAIFANIGSGRACIRTIQQSHTDWTVPRIRIGHPTDVNQSTINFEVSGNINGLSSAPSGSIAIQLEYCTLATIGSDTRIQNVDIGINVTANCPYQHFQMSRDSFDSSVNTPVRTTGTSITTPRDVYGGMTVYPPNATKNANPVMDLRCDSISGRFSSYRYSSDATMIGNSFYKARGTPDVPTNVGDGDTLLNLNGYGYGATDWQLAGNLTITNVGGGSDVSMQGRFAVRLSKNNTVSPSTAFQVEATGVLRPAVSLLGALPTPASVGPGAIAAISNPGSGKPNQVISDGTAHWNYPDGTNAT